ncbi:unnamed protein product [Adineta steineri]|nr:unnamed protein product [Adineta steineri]
MTLASRLSAQANIGNMDKNSELRSMITGNIILTRLQAIVVGFLVALVSLTMGWVSQGHFNLRHTLVLFINISHFVVESCYLLLSFHINIKSIAASLDDLTTLGILASIGEFLFKIIGVGGNLLAVQASRLSTTFHQQGKPREIQDITQ